MKHPVIPYRFIYGSEGKPGVFEYLAGGGRDATLIAECSENHLKQVQERYDCADFRAMNLIRAWFSYEEFYTKELCQIYKKTLLDMPFEDEAGNSMCTWTENHQLCFAASQLLLGERFPKEIFHDGKTGKENAESAKSRILGWCSAIFKFGFSEFGSCNYYPSTFMAIANILEFSKENMLKQKMRMVLDLLCFDLVSSVTQNLSYNKATARAYVDNRANYKNYMEPILEALLGRPVTSFRENAGAFTEMLAHRDENGQPYYQLPQVFKEILMDSEKILKESQGVEVREFKKYGLDRYSDENVRYQMTLGALTPKEVIGNTVRYFATHHMFQNSMIHALGAFDAPILYRTPLLKLIKTFVPVSFDDMATGRGNAYTYVKGNYAVSSLRKYHLGQGSFQQNPFAITIDQLGIFGNCPAADCQISKSPDYWIGSKVNPDLAQDRGTLFAIYDFSKVQRKYRYQSHTFLPLNQFDEVYLEKQKQGYVFVRKGQVNLMMKTNGFRIRQHESDLSLQCGHKLLNHPFKDYDLWNETKGNHYYVFELDDQLPFDRFIEQKLKEEIAFDGKTLTQEKVSWQDGNLVYENKTLSYGKGFFLNGQEIPSDFSRIESKYIVGGRYETGDKRLQFRWNQQELNLDFSTDSRKEVYVEA